MSGGGLRIEAEPVGNGLVVVLDGEVTRADADRLRAWLADRMDGAGGGAVILDLVGVRHMDSSGLSVLIGAHKLAQARGTRLLLRSVPPEVHESLRVAGLLDILNRADP